MKQRYPLNQSPLYRLQSRKRLAELLYASLPELESLANSSTPAYVKFPRTVVKDGKPKTRIIERPKAPLRQIQRRLSSLLEKIEPPSYLHSGYRGRSYVTNARQHQCGTRVAKIDIKSFFPKASSTFVQRCFADTFLCSPDVAGLLTKLVTFEGHIPTGGNSSTMISFWAYRPMFDKIHDLAKTCGLEMTCCVDDLTFSGPGATPGFLDDVRRIILQFGLKAHKRHCFAASEPKVVTGVVLTSKGYRLPNARRKRLHDGFEAVNSEVDPNKRVKLAETLLGRATEASQVEPDRASLVGPAAQLLRQAKLEAR